jgi:hypothetical protein
MDTKGMIDITGADLRIVAKAAYSLSQPRGLGFIHFMDGDLPDVDAETIATRLAAMRPDYYRAMDMDYVRGRCVKLTVYKFDGKHYIKGMWFDHTDADLAELLVAIGKAPSIDDAHRIITSAQSEADT